MLVIYLLSLLALQSKTVFHTSFILITVVRTALHVCQFFIYGSFTIFLILKEKSYSYYYSNILKIHVCFTFLFLFLVHKLMYSDTTIIIPECFFKCVLPTALDLNCETKYCVGNLHTQPLNSTGCHVYSTNSLCLLSFSSLKETCCCPFLRQWHPTPVLLPGKSHRRRNLVGRSPWGR